MRGNLFWIIIDCNKVVWQASLFHLKRAEHNIQFNLQARLGVYPVGVFPQRAQKGYTRRAASESDIHSSLLWYRINYANKKLYRTDLNLKKGGGWYQNELIM